MQRLPDLLRAAATDAPDAPAVIAQDGVVLSYGETDRRVDVAVANLRHRSVATGTRVAFCLDRDADYVVLLWAALRCGAVACPMSPRTPLPAFDAALDRVDADLLVTDREHVPDSPPTASPAALLDEVNEEPEPTTESIPAERAATLLFTSGSTSTPRLALHSYGNHCYSAAGSAGNIPIGDGDRWLLSLPLYHVGGLGILFRCFHGRAAVAIPDPRQSLAAMITDEAVSHVSLVPAQLRRVLRTSEGPGRVSAILLGGEPIPHDLIEEALSRSFPLHTTYGLTEMTSQVTTTPPGATAEQLRTAGRLLPHRRLRLSDDGEILVAGRTLFLGYVDGHTVERPVDEAGWFHTGDRGEVDAAGWLRVIGRTDNLFISGGENVQPEEIEEALCRLPDVVQAVVVPVPHEEYGASPVAFVRTRGLLQDPSAMTRQLARQLPRFKVPDAIYPWSDAPEVRNLKVRRDAFRARAMALQRRDP